MKSKQLRQRPLSSTGRMKTNFKILKSDKKYQEEEDESDDERT